MSTFWVVVMREQDGTEALSLYESPDAAASMVKSLMRLALDAVDGACRDVLDHADYDIDYGLSEWNNAPVGGTKLAIVSLDNSGRMTNVDFDPDK